jgi:hypothetical protein
MEVSDVRRRVRTAIDAARKSAQERRARSDQAAADYEAFLQQTAVRVMQVFAQALVAEGHRFKVFTPAGSVRLASESNPDDFLEVTLDTDSDPPTVIGRTNRGRGRRLITAERPVKENAAIAELTDEDVLTFLVGGIAPFVER